MKDRLSGIFKNKIILLVLILEFILVLWAVLLLIKKPLNIECNIDNIYGYKDNYDPNKENEIGCIENIVLTPGKYDISIDFSVDTDAYEDLTSLGLSKLKLGNVYISSYKIPLQLITSGITLYADSNNVKGELWINSLTKCDDVKISILYNGIYNLKINKIVIRESIVFRFTRLFFILFIIIFVNIFIYNYIANKNVEKCNTILVLIVITVIASLPVFYRYLYAGHDLAFHLGRISEIARGIQNGNWLIKTQSRMLNGYGYATPLFYPQLFLYIPALLYIIGFPLQVAYQIFIFLINLATCFVSYYSIQKVIDDKKISLAVSALYTLSIFRIFEAYSGARLGELLATIFFPLIIYGMYLIYTSNKKMKLKDIMPLVIGVSGIIQSHIISLFITSIFLCIFVLFHLKETFKIERIIALIKAVFITIMINLWFLVPFVYAMRMDVQVQEKSMVYLQPTGAYIMQMFYTFFKGNGNSVPLVTTNDLPMTMGTALIGGVIILFIMYLIEKNMNLIMLYMKK